jgi:hypothetical protein
MESLKPVMSKYLEVTKHLNELNSKAGDLRDIKKSLEMDLAAVYNEQELPDKIELNQSKLVFTVKKPGEWKKGWTLSKKQLEEYLIEILPEHGPDVMKEIIRKHEPKLVSTDYTFDLKPMATSEE